MRWWLRHATPRRRGLRDRRRRRSRAPHLRGCDPHASGALYDHVSIERSINGGITWEPVVLLDDPSNGQIYNDYAAPWDLPALTITYRVRGYRDSDHIAMSTTTSAWNNTAVAPGAAFGIAPSTGGLYVCVPVTDGNTLEVTWNPLNPTSIVQLHGVDYQVALRSPEERGLSVTVDVLVDHIGACDPADEYAPETVSPGAQGFNPLPFEALQQILGRTDATLVLPGGHTRSVIVEIGSMNVAVQFATYIAQLTFTDSRVPEILPYQATNIAPGA